jgi:SAC3 family protein LENG8/THP3
MAKLLICALLFHFRREFANRTFAACTDANRQAVSEELKGLIFKSFQNGTINTTDWDKVELTR